MKGIKLEDEIMNEELLLELKEDNRRMAEEFAQESLADAIVRFYSSDENEDYAKVEASILR